MFLVEDQRHGITIHVFLVEDPRAEGYTGPVTEGVQLACDPNMHLWEDGKPRPDGILGTAPDNPKHYRGFQYQNDLVAAGYQPISGPYAVFPTWSRYHKQFSEAA